MVFLLVYIYSIPILSLSSLKDLKKQKSKRITNYSKCITVKNISIYVIRRIFTKCDISNSIGLNWLLIKYIFTRYRQWVTYYIQPKYKTEIYFLHIMEFKIPIVLSCIMVDMIAKLFSLGVSKY